MSASTTAATASAKPYRLLSQGLPEGPWDAIIVGTGIGGMACGAALAKKGNRCLLLEQHYVPGGYTHVFNRKGFEWDVGVHCVGEMNDSDLPGSLLRWMTDGQLQWKNLGETYEKFFFPDGFDITFPSGYAGFRKTLEEKFPEDRESIARYFDAVFGCLVDGRAYFALKLLPEWAAKLGHKALEKTRKLDAWGRTTAEVLKELVPNSRLRAVLTGQWGYYGSTPSQSSFGIHALTTIHFMKGGFYPVGGSAQIAQHLLKTVNDAGGATVVRASVDTILIENGKAVGVRLQSGQEIRASRVISAAGAKTTVHSLLPESERQTSWAHELENIGSSPAFLTLYLGIEGDLQAAGGTAANQWFMNTWDMDQGEWNLSDPKADAPILYMSFPTLKDPLHVPGPTQRHTAEVVTFVPWSCFEKWKGTRRGYRDADYATFKKSVEDRLLAQLRQHCPKIMDLVKYHELSTPLSAQHFVRAHHGAIYGLEATPKRFKSTALQTRTPIRDLYMAGADIGTLGVTGAMVGGVLAAATIEPGIALKLLK